MHRIRSKAKSSGTWAQDDDKIKIWTPWIRHRHKQPTLRNDPELAVTTGTSGEEKQNGDATEPGKPKSRFRLKGRHKKSEAEKRQQRAPSMRNGKQHFSFVHQMRVIFGSWINILLIAIPIGFASNYTNAFPPAAKFTINFLGIIPLAALLSFATEEIALRVGETLGGLINASFGNAVEIIVSIIALTKNEILIVQTSLVGSILSNLLLVLGMCFLFGGISRVEQFFNVTVAQTAASLLALAIGSLIIPAAFDIFNGPSNYGVTEISRGTSVLLLLIYGCYLFFQLKTHVQIFADPSQKAPKRKHLKKNAQGKAIITGDYVKEHNSPPPSRSKANGDGTSVTGEEQTATADHATDSSSMSGRTEDEPQQPSISLLTALVTLGISTVLVAFLAEFMVGAIDAITQPPSPIGKTFVGLILLPIVGNAAEHVTAVTVAIKDKMDLAIGVAVGSSMQVALLVIPFVVVLGWILHKDKMTLAFDGFQVAVLFVSILLVNYLIQDGKSHWLEGVLLIGLYLIIAVCSWYYPVPANEGGTSG